MFLSRKCQLLTCITPGLVAQSKACPSADPGVASLILAWSHTYVEIDHESFSSLQLIQEGLLSVTSESMCKFQVNLIHWRSQKAENAMHTKGRLLDQVMILVNCVPFQNKNFS